MIQNKLFVYLLILVMVSFSCTSTITNNEEEVLKNEKLVNVDIRSKLIIAHRGFSELYPENSFVAFDSAIVHEADFVEFDIIFSKDMVPVIMHDEFLGRTTNVEEVYGKNLKVSELNSCQLKNLKIDYNIRGNSFKNSDLKIPFFEEMLERYGNKIGLFINVKDWNSAGLNKMNLLLKQYEIRPEMVFFENNRSYNPPSSFPSWVLIFKSQIPAITTPKEIGCLTNAVGLEMNPNILSDAEYFSAMNRLVIIWTVHSVDDMQKTLSSNYVTGIMTDKVDQAVKIRKTINMGGQ